MSKTSYLLHLEWSCECCGIVIFVTLCSVMQFWCVTPFTQSTYYVSSALSMWRICPSMDVADFHVSGKLGKFSYFGTADVKEIIWTERVENCSHKKMGKLRKKSFVCMGFHMMILQRQRKNQLVIEAVQYCLLFRKMVKLICWRGLTPWTWKRIPNFWSTEKLMIYRR